MNIFKPNNLNSLAMLNIGRAILMDSLCEKFYTYNKLSSANLENPEEGIWLCNICNAEWNDGHSPNCDQAEIINAISDFIFDATKREKEYQDSVKSFNGKEKN